MPSNQNLSTGSLLLAAGLCGSCAHLDTPADHAVALLLPSPAWDVGMPDGIPAPERGVLVLEAEVRLDAVYDVGRTPYGLRQATVTQEGTLTGPKIQAELLPGGLDFQLVLVNGVVEVEQIFVLRTSDQNHVIMRNAGTGPSADDLRIVYDFEAPTAGEFAWLNSGKYVGRRVIDSNARTMRFTIYEVSDVAAEPAHAIRIEKPTNVPPQPWDYRHADAGEQRGEEILTEIVTLGRSQRLPNGKRGNRNVIPIAGGTVTGLVTGKVLFGGADYQSLGGGAPPIDARYLWQTTEGDVIIVRNTTNPGIGLVPTFETRVDGKYAWLNAGRYLSSNPGMGAGGLSISMFRSK
ncbi:MAG: DUF3237 domain-containing protein [Gammaproteobacteria bacterium]|nr:DUF3237 domain-containing protein [Gammaproteobacteria bacterium]